MLELPVFLKQFDVAIAGHQEGSTKWHRLSESDPQSFIGYTGEFFLIFIEFNLDEQEWRQVANYLHVRVGRGPNDSIGVVLRFDEDYKERFGQFVREVITDCSPQESPIDTVMRILPRWFAFWDEPHPPLELKNRVGLIGELLVLTNLMRYNGKQCVDSWRSPHKDDDLHDFQGDSVHIEVKTSSSSPRSILIDSINQMDFLRAADNNLQLIVVELNRDDDGFSLVNVVEDARSEAENHEARVALDELLLLYNYHDRHQAFYYADTYSIARILHMSVGPLTQIYTRSQLSETYDSTVVKVIQVVDYLELSMDEIDENYWETSANSL